MNLISFKYLEVDRRDLGGSERLEREALTPLYTMNRPNILKEAKLSCHKK